MLPVYLINGFLESGKTEFISFTLEQPYFRSRGKTLLIVCEEGENDYDAGLLKKTKTFLEVIEEEEDFNPEILKKLEDKYRPERVIIEYNGMWNRKEMQLPGDWRLEQQITNIDARSFPLFYTNMKSMVAEMVRNSELIIFNRCDGLKDLGSFKRNVKAVNPQAEIIFEDAQGEITEMLEEELPFDINAKVVELDTEGFGIWYLDCMDHPDRYEGKVFHFKGQVLKPASFPPEYFVPGRLAMTCCADDMAFLGYVCEFEGAGTLQNKSWVEVTARMTTRYFPDYNGEGPVLEAVEVRECQAPKDPVINFS